jgi:transcriptional regulator with XRE-family HTH domain
MVMIDLIPPPTLGERLFIRRMRDGKTQVEAAQEYGVSAHRYRDWETGVRKDVPTVGQLKLTVPEVCRLRRMRAGMTQGELAKALGISRMWTIRSEAGEVRPTKLVQFWSER